MTAGVTARSAGGPVVPVTWKSGRFDGLLLILMVIALSIQGPTIFVMGGMDFTFGHVLVGLVGAISLIRCLGSGSKLVVPPAAVNILLVVFAVVTMVDASRFGFGSMIFKYLFQYLVLAVALNLMRLMDADRAVKCIAYGAWIVFALVLVNAIVHGGAFLEYYDHPWDGHPNYETVFSGGVNLEATWPAMLGVFMANDRRGWTYLVANVIFSAVVQSRAGLALAVLAFVYVVLVKDGVRLSWRRVLAVAAVVVAAGAFALVGPRTISSRIPADDIVAEAPVSTAPATNAGPIGTPGRKGIWAASLRVFQDEPLFGYGAGNAMDAVRSLSGYPYREDNVHNYPLQILLDFGLVGAAVFAAVVIGFIVANVRARFQNPFAAFMALYLIGGMVQFKGGELLVGFAMAGLAAYGASAVRAKGDGAAHVE